MADGPRAEHAGARLAAVGGVVNAALALIKGVAGVMGHSSALVADAVDSATDVVGSLVTWTGLHLASRSADYEHPYGHGKAEQLSAAVVGLMLCGAAVGIVVKAAQELTTPHELPAVFTLAVLVVVVCVKTVLARTVLRVAREAGSGAAEADAWHHHADALTSGAAFVGISAALIGGPSWAWCDGAAAVAASLIVFFNGVRILRPAIHELMDGIPDAAFISRVATAAGAVAGVRMIEDLKARKVGTRYFIDLHVQADPTMPLLDAHVLGGRVKTAIRAAMPSVEDVLVHMEPYGAGPGTPPDGS
ncbi:MAG TPA: cation diffusion facilitator family transporter [Gemmatimonadales bacterium]|nr:cation diffusion facilitator family transporter [Gemmatimonadales bacterium]